MTLQIPASTAHVDDQATEMSWVLSLEGGKILGLTTSGFAIWRACDGAADRDAVVARLAATQGWDADEVGLHVHSFIDQLLGMNLLEEHA